jgi:hypothetical protein
MRVLDRARRLRATCTWTEARARPRPFQAAGVAYSPSRRTFFIWHNDCGETVLTDAIMSAGLAD